ncbi:hypothetical protein A3A39_01450 [Candidatus Kaiserbacteria bacterium RIFCSPLOWO2_01_FULL_54_13]|uniref:Serine aminopeptidase S33 domain-containing protein n=1 Tax=Candidatus Kaiserbacteria bacterium RIFCSPLOWO2_01_FULL_54_13 TaxID=1798512 RepID=A0A1F6F410_9BACT|nr:MAG: hypothetical protein A3A39_01450 [Candidatus Kaiserbacteria bacterium RIFCSPLOWO2_01_FULL_54_13]
MIDVWPTLFVTARVAVLVYVGLGVVLFLSERRTVYLPDFPAPSTFETCTAFGRGTENVVYRGMRFHHKHVSDRVAVVYHGNAGSACDRAILAPIFERAGYSYVFVEYPGYAGDPIGPSRERILAGVPVVQQFLEAQEYHEAVLVGESLGVGVTAYHASLAKPDRLVFISPYYELADLTGWIRFAYPVRLLMRENYTPGEWMQDVSAPVLFIEAEEDEIVPSSSADRLYASVSGEKTRVRLPGTHNELYEHPEFYASIEHFLKR